MMCFVQIAKMGSTTLMETVFNVNLIARFAIMMENVEDASQGLEL